MSNNKAVAYAKGPEDRAEPLLHVGEQCCAPTCALVDFLPLKCQHCKQAFCGEHYRPETHHCTKYDASKHDRIAPSCPLCNTPVAIPSGQDPNIRMERHITSECPIVTGNPAKKSTVPICGRPKCGKKLFAPIECEKCSIQFCPAHRYPATHPCAGKTGPSVSFADVKSPSQAAAATAAAIAAFRRHMAAAPRPAPPVPAAKSAKPALIMVTGGLPDAKPNTTSPAVTPSASASSTTSKATNTATGPSSSLGLSKPQSNPFSKVDRRAEKERKSRRMAIQARKEKGLVSAEEWARFEAEEAALKDDKKECIIM